MRGEPGREKEGDKEAAVPIIRTGGDAGGEGDGGFWWGRCEVSDLNITVKSDPKSSFKPRAYLCHLQVHSLTFQNPKFQIANS